MAATQGQEGLHNDSEGQHEARRFEYLSIVVPQQWHEALQCAQQTHDSAEAMTQAIDENMLDDVLDSLPGEVYEYNFGNINPTAVIYACSRAVGRGVATSMSLAGYGASHIAFRVEFLDGQSVVFRVPYVDARHPYSMENEVATMEYLRRRKHCPTVQVYAWFPTVDNPTHVPYIIMEDMKGETLRTVWERLSSPGQKASLMMTLAEYHARVTSPVPYDMCGALYFSKAIKDGTVTSLDTDAAYEVGPFIPQRRESVNRDFVPGAWPAEPARDMLEWWESVLSADLDAMRRCWETGVESGLVTTTEQVPWSVVESAGEAVRELVKKSPRTGPPYRIANFDYTFRHVYVAAHGLSSKIVGCIDWQGAQVLPSPIVPAIPLDICDIDLPEALRVDRSRNPDLTTILPSISLALNTLPCGESTARPAFEISRIKVQICKSLDVAELEAMKTIYMHFYRLNFEGGETQGPFSDQETRNLMERIHHLVCGGVSEWTNYRHWLIPKPNDTTTV